MPSALVTSVGFKPFEIVSFVITHLETSLRDGSSNITSGRAATVSQAFCASSYSSWPGAQLQRSARPSPSL